jgi:membrane protease YdiL (CAAX protease family)
MNKVYLSDDTTVAIFGGLTILLSFATYWLPLPREVLPFLIVLIPALLALVFTAVSDGKSGVRALLGKLGRWRISLKWLAIALLLALALRLAMSVAALLLGLIPAIQLRPASPSQLLVLALILIIAAIPEELGWRGYALTKLLTRRTALVASLVIGVLWGTLHLALLLPGMMYEAAPPLPTLLHLIALSVLITWLYVQSGGSVVLTTIFHAAQSFFVIVNEGISQSQQTWLMAGVYLAAALVVAILTGWQLTRQRAERPGIVSALPSNQ